MELERNKKRTCRLSISSFTFMRTIHSIAQKVHRIVSEPLSVERWRSYLLASDNRLHGSNNRDLQNHSTDTFSSDVCQCDHSHCRQYLEC